MARLPWIRLFTEARNDRKLDRLTDREFRIWFKLLCLASEEEPRGVFDLSDPMALAIEVSKANENHLVSAVEKMKTVRLIDLDGSYGYFPAFADRQYAAGGNPSEAPDARNERSRRFRAAKRDATTCNDVQPQEESR